MNELWMVGLIRLLNRVATNRENEPNTKYIRFLKNLQIPNTNSTIWSQLHEYQMIRIICCNSVTQPLISVKDLET